LTILQFSQIRLTLARTFMAKPSIIMVNGQNVPNFDCINPSSTNKGEKMASCAASARGWIHRPRTDAAGHHFSSFSAGGGA
jgi:hypothetical protein